MSRTMFERNSICSGRNSRVARVTCRSKLRASMKSTLPLRLVSAFPLSRNQSVQGRMTV
jgi:hypothetical protein